MRDAEEAKADPLCFRCRRTEASTNAGDPQ
jgi:hypothetical protein